MKNQGIIFAGMGFELLAVILGGLMVGQEIDEYLGSKGLVTAGLSFLLLLGWLWHVIFLLQRYSKSENEPKS